ncbi:MAG: hypothetical protein ACRDVE_08195 [Actinocrinis sp.]
MTRFYRPDRIDYDVVVVDQPAGVSRWATAGVEVVDQPQSLVEGGGSMASDAFRDYASSVAPRLRDFAERVAGVDQVGSNVHRYQSYQAVRAVLRDGQGLLLAEVRCDGSVTITGELDQDLRRQFIGMINGWLPMTIREVDRSSYDNALASLVKARRVVDAMLREVVGLAAGGLDPMPWDRVAAAMGVPAETLDSWYRSPDGLAK